MLARREVGHVFAPPTRSGVRLMCTLCGTKEMVGSVLYDHYGSRKHATAGRLDALRVTLYHALPDAGGTDIWAPDRSAWRAFIRERDGDPPPGSPPTWTPAERGRLDAATRRFRWDAPVGAFFYCGAASGVWKLVPPPDERAGLLAAAHGTFHAGPAAMLTALAAHHVWFSMYSDVAATALACVACHADDAWEPTGAEWSAAADAAGAVVDLLSARWSVLSSWVRYRDRRGEEPIFGLTPGETTRARLICARYRWDLAQHTFVFVPSPMAAPLQLVAELEREPLIRRTHEWAHMPADAVAEHLRATYDWPALERDVAVSVNACTGCAHTADVPPVVVAYGDGERKAPNDPIPLALRGVAEGEGGGEATLPPASAVASTGGRRGPSARQ